MVDAAAKGTEEDRERERGLWSVGWGEPSEIIVIRDSRALNIISYRADAQPRTRIARHTGDVCATVIRGELSFPLFSSPYRIRLFYPFFCSSSFLLRVNFLSS